MGRKLRDCEGVENILMCKLLVLRIRIGSLSKNTLSILLVMHYDYRISFALVVRNF